MEPCRVCGAVTSTAAGYCTGCGTFRGLAAPPVSGTPHPGPISAPPTSGSPAGYPVSGYPAPYPPPGPILPRQRSPYLVPLVALSAMVVVLVVAIVAVIVGRSGGTHQTVGTASPTPSTSALIDSCLIGTWRSTADAQQLDIDGVGQVTVTGQGAVVHIRPDGATYEDYGQSSPYDGTANDHSLSISVTGSVRATIRTASGTMSFQNVQAQGTVTAKVDGSTVTSVPLAADSDPVSYTCSGDTAVEQGSSYRISLARVSRTP